MDLVLTLLPLAATVLAIPQYLPQVLRLRATGRTAGLAWSWAALSCVGNTAWAGYFVSSGHGTAAVPSSCCALLGGMLALMLARRGLATTHAGLAVAAWAAALVVAAVVGGSSALGVVLTATFAVQVAPQVYAVWTTDPAGVSNATWLLVLGELVCWGAYGVVCADARLVTLGVLGVIACALVLSRTARPLTGLRRPRTWPAATRPVDVVETRSNRSQTPYVRHGDTERPGWFTPAMTSPHDDALIALRRDLHDHPEIAGSEERTAAVVAARLHAAGLEVTTDIGGHGVVGILRGALPGRVVAFRADMDAVPPETAIGDPRGPEHLCGHDLHTTIGVGIAEELAARREELRGTLAFVFQPAEETLSGAQAMIDDGVLDLIGAQEMHALHCAPLAVGIIAVTPGVGLPGLDWGTVTLDGPDAAERAESLAADLRTLSTVHPPAGPGDMERLLLDLQSDGGPLSQYTNIQQATVQADDDGSVRVGYSFRCWPEHIYVAVRDRVRQVAEKHFAAAVQFAVAPYPALVCPEAEALDLQEHLERVLGPGSTIRMSSALPFSGEDFSVFAKHLPVTYSFLGVLSPGAPAASAFPHVEGFSADEGAIGVGVRAMSSFLVERAAMPSGT
jgi:metal-dependent amidase/aminoacylase/carboxypeptidase family protein